MQRMNEEKVTGKRHYLSVRAGAWFQHDSQKCETAPLSTSTINMLEGGLKNRQKSLPAFEEVLKSSNSGLNYSFSQLDNRNNTQGFGEYLNKPLGRSRPPYHKTHQANSCNVLNTQEQDCFPMHYGTTYNNNFKDIKPAAKSKEAQHRRFPKYYKASTKLPEIATPSWFAPNLSPPATSVLAHAQSPGEKNIEV